jgi:site-specific DNA recombinase
MTQVSGNGHKRAVLYARVSTDDQKDQGYSLPSQFDAMRKYAAQQDFEIVGGQYYKVEGGKLVMGSPSDEGAVPAFIEDYSGATPIEFRPEGRKAYTLLQSGAADVIVAYTIDRFVRPPEDGDEWDMPILIPGLAKLGKKIHTVRRGKLNTNFADLLIALLDARKAGEERRDIRERSMRGKRTKVKSGKVIGMRAPFGYRQVRDIHGKAVTLEIDEKTARIVRLIYRWYVFGDEHGTRLSDRAIALRLFEMKIPDPGELQRGYKFGKHDKTVWSHSTIRRILANEVYAGGMALWRSHRRNDETATA